MEWQNPETAPKDKLFIAMFDHYPGPIQAIWNGADKMFVGATIQVGPFNGSWDDIYFENEQFSESDLTKWMPMPKITGGE